MLNDFLSLFVNVLLPVFAVVGLGVLLQRTRTLHMPTMTTLTLYAFVPAYLYLRISQSTFTWLEIGKIGAAIFVPMGVVAILAFLTMRAASIDRVAVGAVVVASAFFNAGNFGAPVVELAYGVEGGRVQALVMAFMNLSTFLLAYSILALSNGGGLKSVLGFLRLPFIYVLVIALVMRENQWSLPHWLDVAVNSLALGMIPVALLTLGGQLGTKAHWPRWRLVLPVMLFKLLVFPLVTAVCVTWLGLWPWPGSVLILASAAPSAVNTLLLSLEFDGDADLAADCVFWTTLCSTLTVTIVLVTVRAMGG